MMKTKSFEMKLFFTALLMICSGSVFAGKPKHRYVKIVTNKGQCIIMLYNQTPFHRDNFIKLVKEGYFNGILFHRVINHFMIQGGDPDSKNAKQGVLLGKQEPKRTIPAEFCDSLFHKKGVLAAAREDDNVNPNRESSSSQFYLVQGKVFTDDQLDQLEERRLKFKIPEYQRAVYKTLGGTPHLDRNYTVFGEIVEGLDMVNAIASVQTDSNDRPVEDIAMTITLLKKTEAKKLEKQLLEEKKNQN